MLVFLLTSLLTGFVYWWQADWWAYVQLLGEREKVPKFKLHPAEQFAVSTVVGVFLGGVLTASVFATEKIWDALRSRS